MHTQIHRIINKKNIRNDTIKNLLTAYNEHINAYKKINLYLNKEPKDTIQSTILLYYSNHLLANNIFKSINVPLIQYIINNIDIISLYNRGKYYQNNNSQDSIKNMNTNDSLSNLSNDSDSINEINSFYFLRLLELFTHFNIQIKNDMKNDLYSPKESPHCITQKNGIQLQLTDVYYSNTFDLLKDHKRSNDITINRIYTLLEYFSSYSEEIINSCITKINENIKFNDENKTEYLNKIDEFCLLLNNYILKISSNYFDLDNIEIANKKSNPSITYIKSNIGVIAYLFKYLSFY